MAVNDHDLDELSQHSLCFTTIHTHVNCGEATSSTILKQTKQRDAKYVNRNCEFVQQNIKNRSRSKQKINIIE